MVSNIIAAVLVLGILGAVFGLVLAVASKVFEVKKDPGRRKFWAFWQGQTAAAAASRAAAAARLRLWPVKRL